MTEVEEGQSYAALKEKHGYSVRDDAPPEHSLFHTFNKSEGYIHGRIKLVSAPKIVIEALASGELVPSVALRIARIPDPKLQVAAAAAIMRASFGHTPISDKAAGELIAR